MKKRRVFKKWVENLLCTEGVLFIFATSDCTSSFKFYISKAIIIILMLLIEYLLYRYGRDNND